MQAATERTYDEYERAALSAIMHESAHRAKRPKASDLFKRPVDEAVAKKRTENLLERSESANEWLAQFEQFSGGKEETNE